MAASFHTISNSLFTYMSTDCVTCCLHCISNSSCPSHLNEWLITLLLWVLEAYSALKQKKLMMLISVIRFKGFRQKYDHHFLKSTSELFIS
jgi:hypothetical protein